MLFGEMADVLLASQRVAPAAAEAAGFRFRFRNWPRRWKACSPITRRG